MLTQQRGAAGDSAGGRRELDRRAECLDRTQFRVRRLGHHPAGQRLGVAVHLSDVEHRAGGHAGRLEAAEPVGARARSDDWRQRLGQFDAVGDATVVVGKARVLAQLGRRDEVEELEPVGLVGGAQRDPAIGGLERLVGRVEGMRRAHRAGCCAGCHRDRRLPVGVHDAGLEQRGVDALALAGLGALDVGGEHTHGSEDAGGDIGHRRTAFDRRAARRLAGDAHQPAHALGDQVEAAALGVGPSAAEARDLAVDKTRVVLPEGLVSQPQELHGALSVVLDDDVGVGKEASCDLLATRRLQVNNDATLVAVHHQESSRFAAYVGRQEAARIVTRRRLLELDHVGAHVGKHQTAARPGHDMRELDDPDAGQWSHLSAL